MFSYYTHVQVRYSKAENKTEDKTHEQKQTGSFSKVVGMCSKVVGMCSKVVIYIYIYIYRYSKAENKTENKTHEQKQTGRIYDTFYSKRQNSRPKTNRKDI